MEEIYLHKIVPAGYKAYGHAAVDSPYYDGDEAGRVRD